MSVFNRDNNYINIFDYIRTSSRFLRRVSRGWRGSYEELRRCWVVGNKVSGEILCRIDVDTELAHSFSDLDYIRSGA